MRALGFNHDDASEGTHRVAGGRGSQLHAQHIIGSGRSSVDSRGSSPARRHSTGDTHRMKVCFRKINLWVKNVKPKTSHIF